MALVLSLVVVLIQVGIVPAQALERLARAPVLGLSAAGPRVFWSGDCRDESPNPPTFVRTLVAYESPETLFGVDFIQTIFAPTGCPSSSVVSKNVVSDGTYAYWITRDRRLVRAALDAAVRSADPETLLSVDPPNGEGYYLAADDDWIIWTNGSSVSRVYVPGTHTVNVLVPPTATNRLHNLQASNHHYTVLNGESLYSLMHDPGGRYYFLRISHTAPVAAYVLSQTTVYFASNAADGGYEIYSAAINADARAYQRVYRSAPDRRSDRVDQITADEATLYWHVKADQSGGPILRMPMAGGIAAPITDYILMDAASDALMINTAGYLFWANNQGLFRLAVDSVVVTPETAERPYFQVTDVSPDRPFGSVDSDYQPHGADTGGKMVGLAADPADASVIYAASEFAGVWKSEDAGQNWSQASAGLKNGVSVNRAPDPVAEPAPSIIAADGRERLLYATTDNDLRPVNRTTGRHPFGGLYRSLDGARTWEHVDLGGVCSGDPNVSQVQFGNHRGYVTTTCGVFESDDLAGWSPVALPSGANSGSLVVSGDTRFVCSGQRVYRSSVGDPTWTSMVNLPGNCLTLGAVNTGAAVEPNLLALYRATETLVDVALIDFATGSWTALAFNKTLVCCGNSLVRAVRRPDREFDIFAADGLYFYQYLNYEVTGAPEWARIDHVHDDTHAIAFAANYDPANRRCAAFVATDGGVFRPPFGSCAGITARALWIRAQHGLHAFGSYQIAGFPGPTLYSSSGALSAGQPTLFVSSGDNGTVVSESGGVPGSSWILMDQNCCGDSGLLLIDPETPRVMQGRNNFRVIYERPREPGGWPRSGQDIYSAIMADGKNPPQQSTTAQVRTLPSEAPPTEGDYISARSIQAQRDPPVFAADVIQRNRTQNVNDWQVIAEGFNSGQVSKVSVANGHRNRLSSFSRRTGT
jgi:hypothetical protein